MRCFCRRTLLATAVLLTPGIGTARPAGKPKPVTVATAPSGAFHLEVARANGGPLSVVSTTAPQQRQRLKPFPYRFRPDDGAEGEKAKDKAITTDKLDSFPLAFISPDDRWIYVMQSIAEEQDDGWNIGYLYRRVPGTPDAAPRYEPAADERFDILAFRFLVSEERLHAQHPGELEEEGIVTRAANFVAWSADSARLLIALDYQSGNFPDNVGVTAWLCYFNTRTGTFERTERLRVADSIVLAPVRTQDNVIPGSAAEVLHAESIGQEGPFVPAKDRLAKADERLNAVYRQLMQRLDPSAQRALRQEELAWLVDKETVAAVQADESWSPFVEACQSDCRAAVIEARTAELTRRLRP